MADLHTALVEAATTVGAAAITAVATLVMTVGIPLFMKWAVTKMRALGIDVSDKEQDSLRAIVADAVAFAAQQAGVQVKDGGKVMSAEDKKAAALDFVMQAAAAKGISKDTLALAGPFIESYLGAQRKST